MTLQACYYFSVTWNKQRSKPLTLVFHCLNLSLELTFFSFFLTSYQFFSPATYLPDHSDWPLSLYFLFLSVKKQRKQKGPFIGLAGGLYRGLLYVHPPFLLSALKRTVSGWPLMWAPPPSHLFLTEGDEERDGRVKGGTVCVPSVTHSVKRSLGRKISHLTVQTV